MDGVPVYYSENLLADSDSFSPSAGKPRHVIEAWRKTRLPISWQDVTPVTADDLCLAHDRAFVTAILAAKASNGFGNRRPDVARSLPFTSGAMLGAALGALEGGVACAPVSGFHHAGYASAEGFCTFNGLAVTSVKLLRAQRVKRVLILDLDYHYGNGTDDILQRLDLDGQIENVTFGRWYRTPARAADYLDHLRRAVETFPQFDLILYQAGADLHVDDPLGGVLDSDQLRERDRTVFEAAKRTGVPLAWNLAGGYQEPLSKVVAIHIATMEECVRTYIGQ